LWDAEAMEAGHLDVEEDQIRDVFFDEIDSFHAVFALREEIDLREGFEEESELFASRLFVVNDDGVNGHGRKNQYSAGLEAVASGRLGLWVRQDSVPHLRRWARTVKIRRIRDIFRIVRTWGAAVLHPYEEEPKRKTAPFEAKGAAP